MDEIQRVLIQAGHKDLAQEYFKKITSITIPKDTPSWAKPQGKQVDNSKLPKIIQDLLKKINITDYIVFSKGKTWQVVFKSEEITSQMARALRKLNAESKSDTLPFLGSGTVNYDQKLMSLLFHI
jgi:hypothetical protein